MSLPPPPGSFGSVPPNGGGGPSWGGQPQQPGQPYGAPYQGQPGGQWGPPQQWAGGPPPNKGGRGKWILISLALVAVIAVSVVATVLVLRPESGGGGGSTPPAQNGNSEFASANDTGPVNIITDDPTCAAWSRVARDYVAQADSVKWADRDGSVPASAWTPAQHAMYQKISKALNTAADLTSGLMKQTPHRVMRELYGQFIAYSKGFVETIPTYNGSFNGMTAVISGLVSSASNICAAIEYKSVQSVSPLVSVPSPPGNAATPSSEPRRFLETENSACGEWISVTDQYRADTEAWRGIAANIAASEWTTEQKSIYDGVIPVMRSYADTVERIGRESGNSVFEDISVLSAQYTRAYILAIPNYAPADNFLSQTALHLSSTIYSGCEAVK